MLDSGTGSWSVGHLAHAVREISAASVRSGADDAELAVFVGAGHTTVFNGSATPPTFTYALPNVTKGANGATGTLCSLAATATAIR